ncbi:MAG: BPL-N domain-containing protein [Nitrospiraceae bacterium]|nr:BPL-N domain-containing protein [Nitrospiraceae bacterium]
MKKRSSIHKKAEKPLIKKRTRHAEKGAALLWDESFLWGIMAYAALKKLGLPFKLVRAEDVRAGCLDDYSVIFVPGGWSSNKLKSLGDEGAEAIRGFVRDGGGYLGFCGGAGLATSDGLGLLDVRRKPTTERVPSFSGRIRVKTQKHDIWNGMPDSIFHAWWPPQFGAMGKGIRVLARYGKALSDSFSSDLNTGDIAITDRWTELEQIYKINLDPSRIAGEPTVIEGRYGEGKVILSLIHFDTIDDCSGGIILRNLLNYLSNGHGSFKKYETPKRNPQKRSTSSEPSLSLAIASELESAASDLIDLGIRNFLWFWRNPLLLQWRRGVRGLEYCTLYVMIRQITVLIQDSLDPEIEKSLMGLKKKLLPFLRKAAELLMRERIALQQGHISYERCDDAAIQALREDLFSKSKSYGGQFKELLDEIDCIVCRLLNGQDNCI